MQHDSADRLDFVPPPQPAALRAFVLAIIAHLFLLLALTWGINWKRESDNVAAEAELWSSVPQQAAPKVVQAPPVPKPAPPPPEPKVIAPPPPPQPAKQPDIAVEREKKKQELAQRKQEELERQKKLEARNKAEELEREKKLEARKKEEALKRQAVAEQKAADEKKKKEDLARKNKQDETKLAALRKENLERMMKGLGDPSATGDAQRSSAPSSSYAGRIQARVRPHIVFTDDVSGNPKAEVEVRMAPDGTITSRRLIKSSGVKAWDEAVLRALDKTEILPRDVDGRVHTPLTIDFRPKG